MCLPSGGSSGPPPPDPNIARRRKEELQRQQAEASRLKDEAYRQRVEATYGRRGRASLLAGGKGGRGFELDRGLLTKDTLGA